MNNDLIFRSTLIEKIESTDWYHIGKNGNLATGANSEYHTPLFKADDIPWRRSFRCGARTVSMVERVTTPMQWTLQNRYANAISCTARTNGMSIAVGDNGGLTNDEG